MNSKIDGFKQDCILCIAVLNILGCILRIRHDDLKKLANISSKLLVLCTTCHVKMLSKTCKVLLTRWWIILQKTQAFDLKPWCRHLVIDVVQAVVPIDQYPLHTIDCLLITTSIFHRIALSKSKDECGNRQCNTLIPCINTCNILHIL